MWAIFGARLSFSQMYVKLISFPETYQAIYRFLAHTYTVVHLLRAAFTHFSFGFVCYMSDHAETRVEWFVFDTVRVCIRFIENFIYRHERNKTVHKHNTYKTP